MQEFEVSSREFSIEGPHQHLQNLFDHCHRIIEEIDEEMIEDEYFQAINRERNGFILDHSQIMLAPVPRYQQRCSRAHFHVKLNHPLQGFVAHRNFRMSLPPP